MGERIDVSKLLIDGPYDTLADLAARYRAEKKQIAYARRLDSLIKAALNKLVELSVERHRDHEYAFDSIERDLWAIKHNWRELHPRPGTQPRRSLKQGVRTKVFERDEYTCQECGARKQLAVDHIHPVAKGGLTVLDNLRTLCRTCNSRKGARVQAVAQ